MSGSEFRVHGVDQLLWRIAEMRGTSIFPPSGVGAESKRAPPLSPDVGLRFTGESFEMTELTVWVSESTCQALCSKKSAIRLS